MVEERIDLIKDANTAQDIWRNIWRMDDARYNIVRRLKLKQELDEKHKVIDDVLDEILDEQDIQELEDCLGETHHGKDAATEKPTPGGGERVDHSPTTPQTLKSGETLKSSAQTAHRRLHNRRPQTASAADCTTQTAQPQTATADCTVADCTTANCTAVDCIAADCIDADCTTANCTAADCTAADYTAAACTDVDCIAADCTAAECTA